MKGVVVLRSWWDERRGRLRMRGKFRDAIWTHRPSFILHAMASRSEKFARKPQERKDEPPKEPEEVIKFSPEEEAVRPTPFSLQASN